MLTGHFSSCRQYWQSTKVFEPIYASKFSCTWWILMKMDLVGKHFYVKSHQVENNLRWDTCMRWTEHLQAQSQIIKHLEQQRSSKWISWIIVWCRAVLHVLCNLPQGEISKCIDTWNMDRKGSMTSWRRVAQVHRQDRSLDALSATKKRLLVQLILIIIMKIFLTVTIYWSSLSIIKYL